MLTNAICFNIAWFGCVLIGNAFIPIVLVWVICHFRVSKHVTTDLIFVIFITVVGILVDSFLTLLGVFTFHADTVFIPLWLIFIWISFALTINGYLTFLQNSTVLQLLTGMILAPLSYIAGSELGAVKLGYSTSETFVILSVCWSILLPFFYYINRLLRDNHHVQAV